MSAELQQGQETESGAIQEGRTMALEPATIFGTMTDLKRARNWPRARESVERSHLW